MTFFPFQTRDSFTADNGVHVEESGAPKQVNATSIGMASQGSWYTSPEGFLVNVTWIADENGFRLVY